MSPQSRRVAGILLLLLPAAFFLSVLSPDATEPNALIYLAYIGALSLAVGLLVLGIGLIRRPRPDLAGEEGTPHREER